MNHILNITQRNLVLTKMALLVDKHREEIIAANKQDLNGYSGSDKAMYDRLKVDQSKIEGMILSLEQLASQEDPVGVERFSFKHENGMQVYNKTASFGTVLIIYESRPDVTIEAAGIAFKSGNKILLKGGKESRNETQAFLEKPTQKVDLIVPRGGERLIAFVKEHATCPVIVSGRGNNFVYVHQNADAKLALDNIINGKTDKISACNAVDKVLIDKNLPNKQHFVKELIEKLKSHNVEILGDASLSSLTDVASIPSSEIWYEEFLDYKIVIGEVDNPDEAIAKINQFSGGHSAVIISEDISQAETFMASVDCAAVYHNASSRFTDGFQLGLGGELAISTDKLHQRGPIGLQHLVTNKWYIHGDGQIR